MLDNGALSLHTPQLAFMAKAGTIEGILTEDSDVMLFCLAAGARVPILTKMDNNGGGMCLQVRSPLEWARLAAAAEAAATERGRRWDAAAAEAAATGPEEESEAAAAAAAAEEEAAVAVAEAAAAAKKGKGKKGKKGRQKKAVKQPKKKKASLEALATSLTRR